MRESVPPWWLATQIEPAASVNPSGEEPTGSWMTASSLPVAGSMRRTTSCAYPEAQIEPSPVVMSCDSKLVSGPVTALPAGSRRKTPLETQTASDDTARSPMPGDQLLVGSAILVDSVGSALADGSRS